MDEKWIGIVGGSTLVVFILYRRLMRLFSRQRYSTLRVLIPVSMFGVLALLLFPMLSLTAGLAPTAGAAVGIALGLYGFRLTRFAAQRHRSLRGSVSETLRARKPQIRLRATGKAAARYRPIRPAPGRRPAATAALAAVVVIG